MNVDFILCLDKTNRNPVIDDVLLPEIGSLRARIARYRGSLGKPTEVGRIRVRMIFFGDYATDSEPMVETPFLDVDTDREQILDRLRSVRQGGGGDMPEHSYEALTLGIRSIEPADRTVVFLLTDSTPHPFGSGVGPYCPAYPADMPSSIDELTAEWEGSYNSTRRLLLFAPAGEEWQRVRGWRGCIYHPVMPLGAYCDVLDPDTIPDLLAASAVM